MQILPRLLALALVFSVALRAQSSLEQARRAQLTLGEGAWSQIIRIENASRCSRYTPTVYALVFELQGLLWFYTDSDGTQSFSLYHDNLAAEKADFGPLLHDIEPGFVRWKALDAEEIARIHPSARLRNGCFIESIALWHERLSQPGAADEPRLLSFYVDSTVQRIGHTVFIFREGDTVKLIDPMRPRSVVSLPAKVAADPLSLARALRGSMVSKARFFSLEGPKLPTETLGAG